MPILLLALVPVPPKFPGESTWADEAQRQMNADVLQNVFHLVLGPLNQVVQKETVIDWADCKTGLSVSILSAWIGILLNMRPLTQ